LLQLELFPRLPTFPSRDYVPSSITYKPFIGSDNIIWGTRWYLIRNRNCLTLESTWIHSRFCGGVDTVLLTSWIFSVFVSFLSSFYVLWSLLPVSLILNSWLSLFISPTFVHSIVFYLFILSYGTSIPWLKSAKSILDECGLSYVWTNQYFVSVTLLYNIVKQIVINQFKQIWYSNLQSSPKALNYHMFREQLELEK
jgi:hypothetical protein